MWKSCGGEVEKTKQAVEIMNSISENVWAMVILCLSVVLYVKGQSAAAGTLVSGGLALFQREARAR